LSPITARYEIARLADELPRCMLKDLLSADTTIGNPEAWLALLRDFTPENAEPAPVNRVRTIQKDENAQVKPENVWADSVAPAVAPRSLVAAGPWRSIGGCFDYTEWKDRDRFLELDRAIGCSSSLDEGDGEFDC
jgi:hypothetical protein